MPEGQPTLITWNPRFNTGHAQIDAQHRQLVDLLNRFAAHIEGDSDGHIELFSQFKSALLQHFADEEQVLQQLGIAPHQLQLHARHHHESIQLLDKLGQHLINDPHEYSVAVLAAIAHCLMVDMLNEDSYHFVASVKSSELSRSPPIAPVLDAFSRLVDLLNGHRERIAKARDYYLTLLDDFPTPICRADGNGNFDWFNSTWLALTGMSATTNQQSSWMDAIHSSEHDQFVHHWQACFARRDACTADFRLANATGEWRWIHHIGHPFFDDEDSFLGYICTLVDVTERRRAEDNLRVSAEVFEHAIEAIMITDANGCIEAVNPAFTKISGYLPEEAIGMSTRLLRSGFHDASYYHNLWHTVINTGHWQGEIVNRHKSGELFPVWLTITTIKDKVGNIVRMVGAFNEIAASRSSHEHLLHLAHHDTLTDLPNRLLFGARAEHSLERCAREGSRLAVLFIDLDNFKPVNDRLGHKSGDQLLRDVATRLNMALRGEDTIARFGGDEFVALVERVASLSDAQLVADKLNDTFPVVVGSGQQRIAISASIGISLYPDDGNTVDELIEAADRAMYRVKQERHRTAEAATTRPSKSK